jgi:hypothetical protein
MGKPALVGGGGGLIRHQNDDDDYTCSCGGVAMSCGDGMGPSTQVSGARCMWVPVTMFYHTRL